LDTAVEPRTDDDEHGPVSDALINGQLSEHVLSPKLLEGQR
jgi:hypothetical protein